MVASPSPPRGLRHLVALLLASTAACTVLENTSPRRDDASTDDASLVDLDVDPFDDLPVFPRDVPSVPIDVPTSPVDVPPVPVDTPPVPVDDPPVPIDVPPPPIDNPPPPVDRPPPPVDNPPVCPELLTRCGGRCVDTDADESACGSCNTSCRSDQSCVRGRCACPSGQGECSGRCVPLATDTANCGRCGNRCITGAQCSGGTCACPQGQRECNGRCTATSGEVCDGVDNDCDGQTDEDAVCEESLSLPDINIDYLDHTAGDTEFNGHGPRVEVTLSFTPSGRTVVARACVTARETQSDYTTGQRCVEVTSAAAAGDVATVLTSGLLLRYVDSNHECDDAMARADAQGTFVTRSDAVSSVSCIGDTSGGDICSNFPFSCGNPQCAGCRLVTGFVRVVRRP